MHVGLLAIYQLSNCATASYIVQATSGNTVHFTFNTTIKQPCTSLLQPLPMSDCFSGFFCTLVYIALENFCCTLTPTYACRL